MDDYKVKITPRAFSDIDYIYCYIANELKAGIAADRNVNLLEEAIHSLSTLPYRGAERKVGRYADRGYRQLFVKNYTVVYRIDEVNKTVIIVTVRYSPSRF